MQQVPLIMQINQMIEIEMKGNELIWAPRKISQEMRLRPPEGREQGKLYRGRILSSEGGTKHGH